MPSNLSRLDATNWEALGVGSVQMPHHWWVPLIHYMPMGSHLIEFGCCGASTALNLASSSMRYTFSLLDFNATAITVAKQRFLELERYVGFSTLAEFYVHDVLEPLPRKLILSSNDRPTSNRIAYSLGLLEHFETDDIIRVLKNQRECASVIINAVPNARCLPYVNWKKKLEDANDWPYGYEEPKTRDEMTDLYDAAGFRVDATFSMGDNFITQNTDERYLLVVVGRV